MLEYEVTNLITEVGEGFARAEHDSGLTGEPSCHRLQGNGQRWGRHRYMVGSDVYPHSSSWIRIRIQRCKKGGKSEFYQQNSWFFARDYIFLRYFS